MGDRSMEGEVITSGLLVPLVYNYVWLMNALNISADILNRTKRVVI